MIRTGVFALLITVLTVNVKAQQGYDASLIPKDLLPYASSVVRLQEVNMYVKDLNNSTYHIKQAITILNKNGDDMADIEIWHDKTNVIKYVKGTVYNSSGVLIKKFSESDFEDVNANDGFSLFNDLKVKHYQPSVTEYPYTVEYEYEEREKQSLDFPDWMPNPGTGTAVEKSTFTFSCKPDFNIRYKEINLPSAVSIATDKDGVKTYTWQVSNLKAVKDEPYSPNPEKILTQVKIAPVKFTYERLDGSFSDWNGLGKWIYDKLLINRQQLPAATVQHVKELTAGITDPKLKAKKIYEYMQGRTHYVSVQIGIGGLQPFLASDVDQLNYGDCKALVNYTRALLKAVDIDSWYCVVTGDHSRKTSMLTDFASLQGNHAILCIPFKNDTTWMDCTSQTIPFGYLGDFTDDRIALACTPQGGILLHTPKYTADGNLLEHTGNFILDDNGGLSGSMKSVFKGTEYNDMDDVIQESLKEQIKDMQRIYPINNMIVQKLAFTQDKSLHPTTTEDITLKAPEYASIANGKVHFLLNPINRMNRAPKLVMNRTTDLYINEGYTSEDEITYTIPAGYRQYSEPLTVSIKNAFGTFLATSTLQGNCLIYKRKLQVIDGTYPKESYQDFVDFYQAVVDADDYEMTLVKNN
ncbi:DUF3857 domain-containing protein [Mucilaginibacter sp. E4BP6]|uniref:DUF3857 domain-containing protein n=1 Tax=Mucilaginibacter sp. E4BP6 TaxID=2723089 RepID=UPI0015CBD931|nr:DUF3857 domain-containing protein [Mucilaginibacter sp. E4BP6]NYE65640.1 hypothetical protein [Mucilaginibacter sp. E4BP6]